jgi:protein tyrosine phosphatase type 4A
MSVKGSAMANRPTLIEHKNMRFLIMDAPTDSNINAYLDQMQRNDVTALVRACEPTYSISPVKDAGIHVEELAFTDGEPPPDDVVDRWLKLVKKEFGNSEHKDQPRNNSIAVHCVAGLGRAPILVAIALIESGMDTLDAIDLIRKKRRGAINNRQLKYLEAYKPRGGHAGCGGCAIL